MLRLGVATARRGVSSLRPARCGLAFNRGDSTAAATEPRDLPGVRPFHEMPGPEPLPIIGNLWRFIPGIGEYGSLDLNVIQELLQSRYGNIVRFSHLPGRKDRPMVFVFDPKYAETAFRNEGVWPERFAPKSIPYYREVLRKDFFQDSLGIIFTGGKVWHDFRSKVNQTLMQPRNVKLYVGPIEEVASDLLIRMRDMRNSAGVLPDDFIEYLYRWALESISVIALDTRLGCLDPDLQPDSEPQKMISAVHVVMEAINVLEMKPSFIHFTRRKMWKKLIVAFDLFNEVAMKHIRVAMERIEKKEKGSDHDLSVLESLLLRNDNPKVPCVMALDMMLAGVDTTAHATATVLHFLARNQDKQELLFQELKAFLPHKDQPITAQDLNEMKYLKGCVKESMRLSPTLSGNLRTTVKDIVIDNYLIPKGTDVAMAHKMMCVEEKHYPEPNRYMPERWIKDRPENQKPHPFVFLPFGYGPRSCIGQRFAVLEMEILIAKVIRNYRIEYDQELKIRPSTINVITSPLNFKMEERTGT